MKRWILLITIFLTLSVAKAQQYSGMSGLIHTPSAEMDSAGDVRLGGHAVPECMLPSNFGYNSSSWYMSITPFPWMEIGYTITLEKDYDHPDASNKWTYKDRYFSFKLRPLKEGKYWPAIAIGISDPWSNNGGNLQKATVNRRFANYYVVATKHLNTRIGEFGVNVAYRHWARDINSRWNGAVGGLTYRPEFYRSLRIIGEYDGDAVNVGADCLLFRHFLIQASLHDCKQFSGGVCLLLNLF